MSASSSSSGDDDLDSDSEVKGGPQAKKAKGSVEEAACISDSESSSASSDEGVAAKKKKKKKKKHKREEKSRKKKKKVDTEKKKKKKDKNKDEKQKKKEGKQEGTKGSKLQRKKEKRAKKAERDSVTDQFGKYGVINDQDFFRKKQEFQLWALEVKSLGNIEHMSSFECKMVFKDFIEDYNTATFPSRKYYDLEGFEKLVAAKKKLKGDTGMADKMKANLSSFDDERARKEEVIQLRQRKAEQAVSEEIKKLRTDTSKVEQMKHQDDLKYEMTRLNRQGKSEEAKKIATRMDPSLDEFGRKKRA